MADQFSRLYDVERVGGDQRTRLAELLRSQGMNTPQGQMVGGWYVAPSWSQNLNSALQTGLGTYMGSKIEEERNQQLADLMRRRKEGVAVEQPQQIQNFNGMERMGEGQTPFPQTEQVPQNELERLTRKPQMPVEQSQMNPALIQQQAQPKYRPMTEAELEENTLKMYQVDPRMASVISSMDATRAAREEAKAMKQEQRAWQSQENLLNRQAREDQLRMMASLRPGPQPQAPVAVIGPNGQPMYVAPGQAYGMTPATEAKPLTESQSKAAVFQSQMVGASNQLNNLQTTGSYNPNSKTSQLQTSMAGGLTNIAAPESAQQAKQAQDQWAEAYLRFKTGAAATAGEVEQNRRTFFPVFGDSEKTITQKAAARAQAEQDIGIAAGKGNHRGAQPTNQPAGATNKPASTSNW